jgi:hypothetical protein
MFKYSVAKANHNFSRIKIDGGAKNSRRIFIFGLGMIYC